MGNLEKGSEKGLHKEAQTFESEEKLAQNLSTTLVFDEATRVLSREDVEKIIGQKFWIKNYGEYTNPEYREIQGMNSGYLSTGYVDFEWPSIRCDQEELADILRERGYTLIREGRSGFASRNRYVIQKFEQPTEKIATPLIMIAPLDITDEEKKELGIEGSATTDNSYVIWTGTPYTGELLMRSEIEEMQQTLLKAKEELKKRRAQRMEQYIQSNQKGDISIICVGGGPDDFSYNDIPENYTIISQRRIGCTADHRRNMSHTYQVVLIDKNIFTGKSYSKITVPDEYKGMVIGKGGSTIKSLCERYNCRIIIS